MGIGISFIPNQHPQPFSATPFSGATLRVREEEIAPQKKVTTPLKPSYETVPEPPVDNQVKTKAAQAELSPHKISSDEEGKKPSQKPVTPDDLNAYEPIWVKMTGVPRHLAEKLERFQGAGSAYSEVDMQEYGEDDGGWAMTLGVGPKGIRETHAKSEGGLYMASNSTQNNYGIRARYHESSTEDAPVMLVETYDEAEGKKAYLVNLNDVDARNATMIEGFAMTTYAYKGDEREGAREMDYLFNPRIMNTARAKIVVYEHGDGKSVSSMAIGHEGTKREEELKGFNEIFDFLAVDENFGDSEFRRLDKNEYDTVYIKTGG